jgi:hypothetical protein
MRRILLVLTVALVMVAMLAISVGPAGAYPNNYKGGAGGFTHPVYQSDSSSSTTALDNVGHPCSGGSGGPKNQGGNSATC